MQIHKLICYTASVLLDVLLYNWAMISTAVKDYKYHIIYQRY